MKILLLILKIQHAKIFIVISLNVMLYKFCVLMVANIFKEFLLMLQVCNINVWSNSESDQ